MEPQLAVGCLLNTTFSSVQIQRRFCDNHDDGATKANVHCAECDLHLCFECDQFSHLRKAMRSHVRRQLDSQKAETVIERHEKCIRLKGGHVMVTVDTSNLKAIIEYRNAETLVAKSFGKCRFCGAALASGTRLSDVCESEECQELSQFACRKIHTCGHACGGVVDEETCLPCLQGCDKDRLLKDKVSQDHEDQCMICFTSSLGEEPSVRLCCGHVFHFQCTKRLLASRWNGPRVTFGFAQCPICKTSIVDDTLPCLREELLPIKVLFEEVQRKALMRLDYDGLKDMAGSSVEERARFAMNKYAYYICFRCKKAYFGGDAACDVARGGADFNPEELVCGSCIGGWCCGCWVLLIVRNCSTDVQQAWQRLSRVQVSLLLLSGCVLLLWDDTLLQSVP